MAGVRRWKLVDPKGIKADYQFEQNPKTMGSFTGKKATSSFARTVDGAVRLWETVKQPVDTQFDGLVRTQDMYDALESWSRLSRRVYLVDHYGRSWEVLLKNFHATPVRGARGTEAWRHTYTVALLVYRFVELVGDPGTVGPNATNTSGGTGGSSSATGATDHAVMTEGYVISRSITDDDTLTASEAGQVAAATPASDLALLDLEDGAPAADVQDSETATLADLGYPTIPFSDDDSATIAETTSVGIPINSSDSAAVTETVESLSAAVASEDTSTPVDAFAVAIASSDSATIGEGAAVTLPILSSDSGALTSSSSVATSVVASDSAAITEVGGIPVVVRITQFPIEAAVLTKQTVRATQVALEVAIH